MNQLLIVSKRNFDRIVLELYSENKNLGLDTETTGLLEQDRLFSIIIANQNMSYYFSFNGTDRCLPRDYIQKMKTLWDDKTKIWFIQNAKFDMGMLRKEGVELAGIVHCTKMGERMVKNDHFGGAAYSLAAMAKRRGLEKDPRVDEYVTKHKLYEDKFILGKKFREKHYHKVPFDLMSEYGGQDAWLHLMCGKTQMHSLYKMMEDPAPMNIRACYHNELRLTKVCYEMEKLGVLMDVDYINDAIAYERQKIDTAKANFLALTKVQFKDSNKALKEVFDKLNLPHGVTEKGNPSFNKESLEGIDHPVVEYIEEIRRREKYINTYYINFLYMIDNKNVLRANIDQSGTTTGRFSYRSPNLQNIPKEDSDEYKYYVRKSFVPREDKCFVSIDYKQIEYRVMLDYAGETGLINRINEGEDVHQATAELLDIPRKQAKTVNFAILYGTGNQKLSEMLGIHLSEAKDIRSKYLSRLPHVRRLIEGVKNKIERTGYITNWLGRRCYVDKDFSYKGVNYLVQGSCGDLAKKAMVDIHSKLGLVALINVHDELLFEFSKDQYDMIPEIEKIMCAPYHPKNKMKIEVDVEHSYKSWGYCDLKGGYPDA